MRYHPHTPQDVRAMLETIGAKSLSDLHASIPEPLRLGRPLELPPALDEIALLSELRRLASRNETHHPPFAGAGAYPHHLPPAVDQLLLRGEFFTAYTPYQPEDLAGYAAGPVRVAVLRVPADRPRGRERLDVRRRQRDRRGRAAGRAG